MKNDNLMFVLGILIIIIGVVYGVATETAYNYGSDSQGTISYSPSSYSPSECRNIINKVERQDCINKYNALRECLRNGVTEESLSNRGTCTDGIDNDCDGLTDLQEENCGRAPIVCDADLDGYVKDNIECPQSPPYDCDDNDVNVNPDIIEICGDLIDNNCDGNVDESCNVCSDSDDFGEGGFNYFWKGTCINTNGNYTDYCDSSGRVVEYGCGVNSECEFRVYECERNGFGPCVDGVCGPAK